MYSTFGFFIFGLISTVFAVLLPSVNTIFMAKNGVLNGTHYFRSYECGFESLSSVTLPFNIHFYRVGVLFLIFDLEMIFLFPWGLNFYAIDVRSHMLVYLFFLVLVWGFIFEWSLDVLNW